MPVRHIFSARPPERLPQGLSKSAILTRSAHRSRPLIPAPCGAHPCANERLCVPELAMSMKMHVAEAKPGQLATTHQHYFIERPCRILIIGEHLKAKTKYQCLLRHISIAGAMLDFNAALMVPKHFFLQIDGFKEEIGCSQVHRSGAELGVRFNMLLAPDFVSRLIRMQFSSGGF
ncbi:hypothetical protein [Ensifer sp.]|uniref:hypothetical protein n=1 Tax=Ensifer sp. TaxID=1872086 RepID=UPI00289F19BF|nr:hypothetical protein [Ensifer sp.]